MSSNESTRSSRTQKGLSSLGGSKVPPGVNELVKTKPNGLQEAETNEDVKAEGARWVSERRWTAPIIQPCCGYEQSRDQDKTNRDG